MAGKDGLSGFSRKWCLALAILLGMFFATSVGWSQEVAPTISVTVNKSLVFRLAQKARRVSVTQPEVAEVVVVAPAQLLINGKSVGATSLIVWDDKGEVTNFDLVVMADVGALRRQLRGLLPDEKVEVSTSGPSIVLKGEVSNEVVYDKVLEITMTYLPPKPKEEVAPAAPSTTVTVGAPQVRLPQTGTAFAGGGQLAFVEEGSLTDTDRWGNRRAIPGVIDLLVIKEVRQVELDVIVAEVSLTKLRELGLDVLFIVQHGGKTSTGFSKAGSQGGFQAGNLFQDPSTFPPTTTFGGGTSAIVSLITDRYQVSNVFRLFQNRDITEILAQPKLVMKNGRSGGFLAGGEFPIPIATRDEITVEFKPFGVRLDFVPTITWSNSIDLRVFPEVSEIDSSVSVSISGVSVPGLKVRRSVNRLEMKEGESLLMSGLLDRKVLKDLTKFPILGDVPILGALFRSTRFRNQETELVFVITPKIVKALKPGQKPEIPSLGKYDDPDMRQIPLPNSQAPDASMGKPAPQGPTMP